MGPLRFCLVLDLYYICWLDTAGPILANHFITEFPGDVANGHRPKKQQTLNYLTKWHC